MSENAIEFQDWLLDLFSKQLSDLAISIVQGELTNLEGVFLKPVRSEDWRDLLLAASIMSPSKFRRHQEAALRIATAGLTISEDTDVRDAAAIILEKLGNTRAVELAEDRNLISVKLHERLGYSMKMDADRRELMNSVLLQHSGNRMQVNRFQRSLWDKASTDNSWTSASAPTASGKTYLVLRWLTDRLMSSDDSSVIYLAPTRALVSEIQTALKALSSELEIFDVTSLPLMEEYTKCLTSAPMAQI